jgi:hypothetical protein
MKLWGEGNFFLNYDLKSDHFLKESSSPILSCSQLWISQKPGFISYSRWILLPFASPRVSNPGAVARCRPDSLPRPHGQQVHSQLRPGASRHSCSLRSPSWGDREQHLFLNPVTWGQTSLSTSRSKDTYSIIFRATSTLLQHFPQAEVLHSWGSLKLFP